jgi:hypothetical protein
VAQALLRKAGPLEDETGLHLLALSPLLFQLLGPELLLWDSKALRQELEGRFGNIGPVTWERIQALRVLHSHDAFWTEWEVFENITAAILGEPPVFSHTQPPEAEEIAVALVTAARVDKHTYSEEVQGYIAGACLFDGFWYLDEPPLDVAREVLREYDLARGIDRNFGGVAGVLQQRDKFLDEPGNSADVQADKVLEVRMVLRRYNAAVGRQLKVLPSLVERYS